MSEMRFLSGSLRRLVPCGLFALSVSFGLAVSPEPPPNILWITAEDVGPEMGCYGDGYAVTPNLDAFAKRSLRYNMAWSVAPVCAPARTAIITGCYPNSVGGEHMRSMVALPGFMKLYPQLLRERGYYCSNNSKTDYNVIESGEVWDDSSKRAHWKNRREEQPFFAIFNSTKSHEGQIRNLSRSLQHDPAQAPLPAYHPDTPESRRDWARYYDAVTAMDSEAGERLRELEAAGLVESTIIFFYGDHGSGMPRSKRWPYNSGLQVPLLVFVPEKFRELAPSDYQAGGASDRLVSFVDLAPTVLSLAGNEPPDWMQGGAFMGHFTASPPKYAHGQRGRMDERFDLVRSVTDGRFVYIRNYHPHLIYGQYIDYMFQTPTTRVWKELYDKGTLQPPQTFFWEPKPTEELYDLQADPDEVNNLAIDPGHTAKRDELANALRTHLLEIRDAGFLPEAERVRRTTDTTVYEYCHDPTNYPLHRLLDVAEAASSRDPDTISQLKQAFSDAESGVRYWAAIGVLIQGESAADACRAELRKALSDETSSVRIAAAEPLARFGDEEDREAALAVLGELVSPVTNGVYISMAALNAVDALGPRATPLLPTIRNLATQDPKADARLRSYIPNLLKSIQDMADVDSSR